MDDPQFADANSVNWLPATQVIGVATEGEAKAYPFFIMDLYHHLDALVGGDPLVYST